MTMPPDPNQNPQNQPYTGQPGAYPQGSNPEQVGGYPPDGSSTPPSTGPYPPAPETPGAPAKPSKTIAIRLLSALVAVAVAIGVYLFFHRSSAAANASVGECLKVQGSTTVGSPKTDPIACTDPAALFVVTDTGDENLSCEKGETTYQEYSDKDSKDVKRQLCLRPNFTVGGCFVEEATEKDLPQVGDCTSLQSDAKFKVVKIDTASSDASKCDDPDLTYSYPKRNLVVCFAQP